MCINHIPNCFELLPPVRCIFCPVRASGAYVSFDDLQKPYVSHIGSFAVTGVISQPVQRLGDPFAWSATRLSFTWWHWWPAVGDGQSKKAACFDSSDTVWTPSAIKNTCAKIVRTPRRRCTLSHFPCDAPRKSKKRHPNAHRHASRLVLAQNNPCPCSTTNWRFSGKKHSAGLTHDTTRSSETRHTHHLLRHAGIHASHLSSRTSIHALWLLISDDPALLQWRGFCHIPVRVVKTEAHVCLDLNFANNP